MKRGEDSRGDGGEVKLGEDSEGSLGNCSGASSASASIDDESLGEGADGTTAVEEEGGRWQQVTRRQRNVGGAR